MGFDNFLNKPNKNCGNVSNKLLRCRKAIDSLEWGDLETDFPNQRKISIRELDLCFSRCITTAETEGKLNGKNLQDTNKHEIPKLVESLTNFRKAKEPIEQLELESINMANSLAADISREQSNCGKANQSRERLDFHDFQSKLPGNIWPIKPGKNQNLRECRVKLYRMPVEVTVVKNLRSGCRERTMNTFKEAGNPLTSCKRVNDIFNDRPNKFVKVSHDIENNCIKAYSMVAKISPHKFLEDVPKKIEPLRLVVPYESLKVLTEDVISKETEPSKSEKDISKEDGTNRCIKAASTGAVTVPCEFMEDIPKKIGFPMMVKAIKKKVLPYNSQKTVPKDVCPIEIEPNKNVKVISKEIWSNYCAEEVHNGFEPNKVLKKIKLAKPLGAIHEKGKSHKCAKCSHTFKDIDHLNRHILTIHMKLKFRDCSECVKNFRTRSARVNHILATHMKAKSHKCNECEFSCSEKDKLSSHRLTEHKLKCFQCYECTLSFHLSCDLNQHLSSVHGKLNPFKCTKCNSSFSMMRSLLRHNQSIHGRLKPQNCINFDKSYISEEKHCINNIKPLRQNSKSIRSVCQKPHKCSDCDSAFYSKSGLSNHILTVHLKVKRFKCSECNLVFSFKYSFSLHMLAAHGKWIAHKCLLCNKQFSCQDDLSQHIRGVHQKLKHYKCRNCGLAFSDKSKVISHITAVHKKLKPFGCTDCSLSFRSKGGLNNHVLLVHLKVKPFKCSECNVVFGFKHSFLHHILAVHGKWIPYSCSECTKTFSSKINLLRHSRIHKQF